MTTKVVKTKGRNKAKAAHIHFVLDRSGSMGDMQAEAIGGFNAYVADQRKVKAPTKISLYLFDNEYIAVYEGTDIKKVKDLDAKTYMPRGTTALYDAVGKTIRDNFKAKSKVQHILAILTDGFENASQEFSRAAVNSAIKEVQDAGWEVMFLGANMTEQQISTTFDTLKSKNIAAFKATGKGVMDAIHTHSIGASAYRGLDVELNGVMLSAGTFSASATYSSLDSGAAPNIPLVKGDDTTFKTITGTVGGAAGMGLFDPSKMLDPSKAVGGMAVNGIVGADGKLVISSVGVDPKPADGSK